MADPQAQQIDIPGVGVVEFPASMSDADISKAAAKLHADATPSTRGVVSKDEPSTFMGGFLKSINDQAGELGRSLFQSSAYPQSAGDFLSLMLPGTTEAVAGPGAKAADASLRGGIKSVGEGLEKAGNAAKPASLPLAVTDAMVRGKLGEAGTIATAPYAASGAGKILQRASKIGEEPSILSTIDRYAPSKSGYSPSAPAAPSAAPILGNINEMPLHMQMEHLPQTEAPILKPTAPPITNLGREVPAAPPPIRPAGTKAQSLEDALVEALSSREPEAAPVGTLPPELTTAGEGPIKQSGKFGKSGKLGQAGGYSSGRPAITPTLYDELLDKLGGRGAAEPVGGLTSPDAVTADTAAPQAPNESRDLGEPRPITIKADKLSPDDWMALRRQYGAKKLSALTGVPEDEIRLTRAPGPSRIPTEAQDRIDAFNARQATERDK